MSSSWTTVTRRGSIMPKAKLQDSLRQAVFQRDEWKCRRCGSRSNLHPHHLTFRSHGGTHTMENLLTLCWKCHQLIHDGKLTVEVTDPIGGSNSLVRFWRKS